LEAKGSYSRTWREAAENSEFIMWMTADELTEFNRDLVELLVPRFRERQTDPSARPPGALPVELLHFSYPLTSIPEGQS
jgi:hypothetical protein